MQPATECTDLEVPRDFLLEIPKVIDQITFKTGRKCYDGLCCFFPAGDHGVKPYKDWTADKVLLIGTIDAPAWQQARLADRELPDLLRERGIRVAALCACEELQLELAVEGDTLVLALGCGVYEDRPEPCRTYPEVGGKPCTFSTYCGGPRAQVNQQLEFWGRPGGIAIFILALDTARYPGFEAWSIGQSRDHSSGARYTLIPVPWFSRYRELIPDWDERKGPMIRNYRRTHLIALVLLCLVLLWLAATALVKL